MGEKINNKRVIDFKRIGVYIVTFLLAFIIVMSAVVTKKYTLIPGDIAKVDIKAPRDTIDETATKAKEQEAASQVDKQYTLKTDVSKNAEESIKNFLSKVIALKDSTAQEADKLKALKDLNIAKLDEEDYKYLLSSVSKEDLTALQSKSMEILAGVYGSNIEEDSAEDLQNAKNYVEGKVSGIGFVRQSREIINTIIQAQIKPNFFYDKEKTDEKMKEAEKNVPKIVIKKNQIIVKEGEPVTASQIEVLKELGLLKNSGDSKNAYIYPVLALLVAIILSLQYFYIRKYYRKVFENVSKLMLINIINIITLVLARTLSLISPYLIPLAFGAIMLTLLINYKISLVVSLLNCVLISAITGFRPEIMIVSFIATLLGATYLRKMQQRNDILLSTAYMAIVCAIVTFTVGSLLSNDIMEVLTNTGIGATGIILSGILAIGFLPMFESIFDIVTTVKLLELSNPNSPLLKKLLMEAPGTYHHSVLVSNLAELAAEEIGGNAVLARIGAFYHDIGKIKRPYFFKENQIGKDNAHDKITPNLSTLIITSHVKDGLELAKDYNLPKVIQDMIAQHHGTTLVKYFYHKMKQSMESEEEVKVEDFTYPGPIPESKEAGIIMLADSVEAAVRSISDPTKGKIEEMVNNIIKDKLYSGQLDNCDLTLKDLTKVRECFLKVLSGIYHQRIEYPTDEKGVKN